MTEPSALAFEASLAGGVGWETLPAATSPLAVPVRAVIVQTAGNMGLVLANGTDNDSALIAVTAGMVFNLQAIAVSPSNTAVLLGVR